MGYKRLMTGGTSSRGHRDPLLHNQVSQSNLIFFSNYHVFVKICPFLTQIAFLQVSSVTWIYYSKRLISFRSIRSFDLICQILIILLYFIQDRTKANGEETSENGTTDLEHGVGEVCAVSDTQTFHIQRSEVNTVFLFFFLRQQMSGLAESFRW